MGDFLKEVRAKTKTIDEIELQKIKLIILKATEMGNRRATIYQSAIKKEQIYYLKQEGFNIQPVEDWRDGDYYIINW